MRSFFICLGKYVLLFVVTAVSWGLCVQTVLEIPSELPVHPIGKHLFEVATRAAFRGLWIVPTVALAALLCIILRQLKWGFWLAVLAFLWGTIASIMRAYCLYI